MEYAFQLTSAQIIAKAPYELPDNINCLLKYFTKTYISSQMKIKTSFLPLLPLFLKELWNVHKSVNQNWPRTNNSNNSTKKR